MDRMTRWETEALRRRGQRPRPRSRSIDLRDRPTADTEPDQAPPGTLLVPLDAWQRMLDQLGNLHEAGQQLAEVSARAAKAETEAEFLRERVAELRSQLAETADEDETETGPIESEAAESDSIPDESGAAKSGRQSEERLITIAASRARSALSDLRQRRRRRAG